MSFTVTQVTSPVQAGVPAGYKINSTTNGTFQLSATQGSFRGAVSTGPAVTSVTGTAGSDIWFYFVPTSAGSATITVTGTGAASGTVTVSVQVQQMTCYDVTAMDAMYNASGISPGTEWDGVVPFTVTFKYVGANASMGTFAWDFGDGGTGTGATVQHTYSTPGGNNGAVPYRPKLTASGPCNKVTSIQDLYIYARATPTIICTTDQCKNNYIYRCESGGTVLTPTTTPCGVVPPVADIYAYPSGGLAPLTVSYDDQGTGSPTSRTWNFGDGTANSYAKSGAHVYNTAGTYTLTLTISNSVGSDTKTRTIIVQGTGPIVNPPVVNFTASPLSGTVPLVVQFADASTNGPTAWQWDFGDGQTTTMQNPSHTYTNVGSYIVKLTASNNGGAGAQKTATIVVTTGGGVPCTVDVCQGGYIYKCGTTGLTPTTTPCGTGSKPAANFTPSPPSGAVPLAVQFNDLSTGEPTSWTWDFGDGGMSYNRNPAHTYQVAGNYLVTLTATNAAGSSQKTVTITVSSGADGGGGEAVEWYKNPIVLAALGLGVTGIAVVVLKSRRGE